MQDENYHDDPSENEIVEGSLPLRKFLFLGLLSIALLGSTYAANINLGSSSSNEFGQGILVTTACDSDFTIRPSIAFSNGSNAKYVLSGFQVTNLNSSAKNPTTGQGCQDTSLTISIWGDTGTALATYVLNNYGTSFTSSDGVLTVTNGGTSSSSVTIVLNSQTVDSTQIRKISVQTGIAPARTYVVGDTGPGGGTVFYVNSGGFSCGPTLADTCHYMEYAPANWANVFPEWTTPSASGGWSDKYALVNGAVDPPIPMIDNCSKTISGSAAIGASLKNTIAIAVCSSVNAAEHVRLYSGGGKTDWGIPTQYELNAMNNYRKTLYPNWASVNDAFNAGISTIDAFWTSTGSGNGFKFEYLNRDTRGTLGPTNITYELLIKPVRAF